MKPRYSWALNPCLLMMLAANASAEGQKEESLVVSASRTNHSITDMAQTTWVIEQADIEQQVQGGKELKEVLAQLIPGMDVSSQGRTNYGMNMRGRS
ncbi:TonB-dependent receptor plug domain-containing protein, partial [Staphylococcus hominis]